MIPFKTVFIVNPKAGGGRAMRVWRRMESLLRDAGQSYQLYYTRCRGDATSIAEKARSNGAELIVGVGGDGTLLEVVNGLDLKKNILGIIPAGTGNGFRRSLKIPGNCLKALLEMPRWKPRRVDIGTLNGIRFLNVAGFGFDAKVTQFAKADDQKLPGYSAYVAGFLKELASFSSFPTKVKDMENGKTIAEARTFIALVANGRYYGGQLCIAPHADVTDGQLNLLLVRRMNYVETATLTIRAFFKKHLGHSAIYTSSCREVTISAGENIPVHVDGELMGSLPAKIAIHPGALHVLTPPVS
ncbi:MAG TPA: diacylglycerol kinase family lipid kinase [Bacillota bacterium]|nr:diacylglycerol kinase family lipid kinase [Bacillota bacterium]HOA36190.1 diacylglycerol kinase family lipid kinase [Bacillota bacterium]HOJ84219.1 diacylglycerol kinase family lipid kinase [Bacillota bacterium]HOL16303.1 diacylglycerol kinase family lipid kinase [Bacillota bacterium]HPZ12256.1 diacylglycerol kinase family lipid kinase [Bacillota bacterium]